MLILCSRIQSLYSRWCRNEMEREAGNLISGRRRKVSGAGQRQDRIVSGNYFRSSSSVRLRKKKNSTFGLDLPAFKKSSLHHPLFLFFSRYPSAPCFLSSSLVLFCTLLLSFLCAYFHIFVHLIDINCCPKIWNHFLVNGSLIGSG